MSAEPLSSLSHTKQRAGLDTGAVSQSLTEYRCVCGKLLFKGSLFLSVVETKCKRCGSVRVFRHLAAEVIPFSSLAELMSKVSGAQATLSGCVVVLHSEPPARRAIAGLPYTGHANKSGTGTDLSTRS